MVLHIDHSTTIYLFIEYATSAGHHKKTCIHTEMRKRHKTLLNVYVFLVRMEFDVGLTLSPSHVQLLTLTLSVVHLINVCL